MGISVTVYKSQYKLYLLKGCIVKFSLRKVNSKSLEKNQIYLNVLYYLITHVPNTELKIATL